MAFNIYKVEIHGITVKVTLFDVAPSSLYLCQVTLFDVAPFSLYLCQVTLFDVAPFSLYLCQVTLFDGAPFSLYLCQDHGFRRTFTFYDRSFTIYIIKKNCLESTPWKL